MNKLKLKDLNLFGDEPEKETKPSLDDVIKRLDALEKEKANDKATIDNLSKQLEEEKLKNAQFRITGLTKKVEPVKEEEPVEFDFDF